MPLPEILLSRELAALGMDRQLRAWRAHGTVHRIIPGAYVKAPDYFALGSDDRYRLLVTATSLVLPGTQFSHDSAAALWRLPSLGSWPASVHAAAPREGGGRSTALLARHSLGLDPRAIDIDGVTVTSLARTLADAACQRSFARAVVMLDDGLRAHSDGEYRYGMPPSTKDAVILALDSLGKPVGHARAARAIAFADSASGSAGESLSRVQMLALRVPMPQLQVPFYDHDGLIGITDYYWPELDIAGEFDGHSKYGDARRHARGLSPEQILIAEKTREDRLRRVVSGVVRWDWATALDRRALGGRLARAGIAPAKPVRRL